MQLANYSFESARSPVMRRRGVGTVPIQSTIASQVGSGLLSIAPATGPAAPFVAAAAGIAQLVSAAFTLFQGCGQSCVQTSNYANQAEGYLNQIKTAYFATPTPRPQSFQQQTLAQIQQIFTWLQQMCSQPNTGTAGQHCISERLVQGGTAPWCPNPGNTGCDWITTYYLPIENDPNVQASTASSILNSLTGSSTVAGSNSILPVFLILAAAVGAMVLL